MSTCNIFKLCGIDKWTKCSKQGEVSYFMNRKIKSSVFLISGSVPAANYILFPRTSSQSLNLTERYLYLIWKPVAGRFFVIHIDIVTTDGLSVRLSLSNLYKQFKCSHLSVQFPYVFDASTGKGCVVVNQGRVQTTPTPDNSQWTILVIDMSSVIAQHFKVFGSCYGYLKTVMLCANMMLKGLHCSNVLITTDTLPRDMLLPLTKGLDFVQVYDYLIVSGQFSDTVPSSASRPLKLVGVTQGVADQSTSSSEEKVTALLEREEPSKDVFHSNGSTHVVIEHHSHDEKETSSPVLSLVHAIGLGPCNKAVLSKLGNRLFFTCNSIVVAMENYSKQQQFFIGHNAKVLCLAVNEEMLLMSTAEEKGLVRLWDIGSGGCTGMIKSGGLSKTTFLCFSPDGKILAVVASDAHCRTVLALWDTASVDRINQSISNTSITAVKLTSSCRMVSCGRGNIRIWRRKDKQLKSTLVDLEDHRSLTFTDISVHGDNLYSSTNLGHIFEVDLKLFTVQRIWLLFPEQGVSINTLAFAEDCCITGSDDGVLRVWPLDFSTVLMETDVQEPVLCVDVASNETVLCVTQSSVGLLSTNNQCYTTVLRSHTQTIISMGISLQGDQLVTLSLDGTIRIWNIDDTENYTQVYQFHSTADTPTIVSFVPTRSDIVSGYDDGTIRVLSLDTGEQRAEHRHCSGKVVGVVALRNGNRMYSSSSGASLVMYDSSDPLYPILKSLDSAVSKGARNALSLSSDDSQLACCGPSEYNVTIYSSSTLLEVMCIDISTVLVIKGPESPVEVMFLSDQLFLLTYMGSVLRCSCVSRDASKIADSACCMAGDGSLLFIGNSNGSVSALGLSDKVTVVDQQLFIGHCSAVQKILVANGYVISCADEILIWKCNDNKLATPFPSHYSPPRASSPPVLPNDTFTSPCNVTSSYRSSDSMSSDKADGNIDKSCDKSITYFPKPHELFIAPNGSEVLKLQQVIGYTGSGCGNLHWYPPTGVVCYSSGCVVVVEDSSSQTQEILIGHHTQVTALALQVDGSGLASASCSDEKWKSEIRVWELLEHGYTCAKVLPLSTQSVLGVAYSPDNRFLLSIEASSCEILLWNCVGYDCLTRVKTTQSVCAVAWDPSTAYEYVSVGVAGLEFWMLEENKNSFDIRVHKPERQATPMVSAVSYSMEHQLFTGSDNGVVSMWNTLENCCVMHWRTGLDKIGALCSNTNSVVVGGANGVVQLWEVDSSLNVTLKSAIELLGAVTGLSFDKELHIGVVGTSTNTLWLVDWTETEPINIIHGHYGDDKGSVTVWGGTQEEGGSLESVIKYSSKTECVGVCFSSVLSPLSVVCGYKDGLVKLFTLTGKLKRKLQLLQSVVTNVFVKNDLVISSGMDGVVMVTDIHSGKCTASITEHQGSAASITDIFVTEDSISVPGLAVHSFHLMLISSLDRRISVWQLSHSPQLIDWISFPGPQMTSQALTSPTLARFMYPDTLVYTGHQTQSKLYFYSLTLKKVVKQFDLQRSATCLCLSHDYQMIAFGSYDQTITVMDTDEGSFQEYHAHSKHVSNIAFAVSDKQLLSTSSHNFHIWSVK